MTPRDVLVKANLPYYEIERAFDALNAADLTIVPKSQDVRVLAEAMQKFAPDLMKEFAERWAYAKLSPDQKLDQFLAVLRGQPAPTQPERKT